MALTRFKDARAGYDGPVSGALQVISMNFTEGAAGGVYQCDIDLPAGMRFRVTDVVAKGAGIVSDPSLTIGSSTNATSLVAAVNVTTNLGALTLKAAGQHVATGGVLRATITNDAGDTFDSISLTIVGHVSDPPTSVDVRGPEHY